MKDAIVRRIHELEAEKKQKQLCIEDLKRQLIQLEDREWLADYDALTADKGNRE